MAKEYLLYMLLNLPFPIPGAESSIPDNGSSQLRRFAHCPHVLQPAVPARLRQLRAARPRPTVGHQRGRRGLRHDIM